MKKIPGLQHFDTAAKDNNHNGNPPPETRTCPIIIEIIEFFPKGNICKTIIKKTEGTITVSFIDKGEKPGKKSSPFDTYIQIIEGNAELILNDQKYFIRLGEGIMIPAHATFEFGGKKPFKLICTMTKSDFNF